MGCPQSGTLRTCAPVPVLCPLRGKKPVPGSRCPFPVPIPGPSRSPGAGLSAAPAAPAFARGRPAGTAGIPWPRPRPGRPRSGSEAAPWPGSRFLLLLLSQEAPERAGPERAGRARSARDWANAAGAAHPSRQHGTAFETALGGLLGINPSPGGWGGRGFAGNLWPPHP